MQLESEATQAEGWEEGTLGEVRVSPDHQGGNHRSDPGGRVRQGSAQRRHMLRSSVFLCGTLTLPWDVRLSPDMTPQLWTGL